MIVHIATLSIIAYPILNYYTDTNWFALQTFQPRKVFLLYHGRKLARCTSSYFDKLMNPHRHTK